MNKFIKITDFSAPELDVFVRLTGAQLRSKAEPELGIFIAESPTVIEVALNAGCEPVAFLTDERLINGAVSEIIERVGDIPIYVAPDSADTWANPELFQLNKENVPLAVNLHDTAVVVGTISYRHVCRFVRINM
jgi:hypothetical protein